MKILTIAILIMGIMLSGSATAKIYRYVDDNGHTNFTDDLSTVPKSKCAEVTEHKETPTTYTSPSTRAPESVRTSPSQHPSQTTSQNKERLLQKQQLETEYQKLLKDKEALDNNKAFQKRREKRKYWNRPHIKELVEKEQQIIQRLKELEQALKSKF